MFKLRESRSVKFFESEEKKSVKDLNWNLSIKQEKRVTTLKGLKSQ